MPKKKTAKKTSKKTTAPKDDMGSDTNNVPAVPSATDTGSVADATGNKPKAKKPKKEKRWHVRSECSRCENKNVVEMGYDGPAHRPPVNSEVEGFCRFCGLRTTGKIVAVIGHAVS